MMSQALRKIAGAVHQADAIVLFINQTRQKIGVTFGPTTTTTGGTALRFYASVRLEVRRIGAIKSGEEAIGNRTVVKVAKNKVAPPFRRAELDIVYGKGFDWAAELVDLGVAAGHVEKSGAWFSMDGERLGQGRDRAARTLEASPDRCRGLQDKLYAAAGLTSPALKFACEAKPSANSGDRAAA
jgi:recombination protein RecA